MRLKLRTSNGDFVLGNDIIDASSDLQTLLLLIEGTSNIPIHQINSLVVGYPPKQVKPTVSNKALSLSDLNIKNGDLVTVKNSPERTASDETKKHSSSPSRKRSSSSEVDVDYLPGTAVPAHIPRRRVPSRSKASPGDTIASPLTMEQFPQSGAPNAIRFEVPADNTCLFYSLYFLLHGNLDREKARCYRTIVSNKILTGSTGIPDFQPELMLGRPVDEYCAWIQSDDSWGGSIELAILSNHFRVCINAVDVKTLRIDRYPADGQYIEKSIFMLYDGIHYDALYLGQPESSNSSSQKITQLDFSMKSGSQAQCLDFKDRVEQEMTKLAQILQIARQYTDTSNFNLRCGTCNNGFRSQNEALEHAKHTGHANFQEIT